MGADGIGSAGVCHFLEASSEDHKRRRVSLAVACAAEGLALAVLPFLPLAPPKQESRRVDHYVALTLPSMAEQKQALKAPALPRVLPKAQTASVLPLPRVESPPVSEPRIRPDSRTLKEPVPAPTELVARAAPLPPAPPVLHTGVFGQPSPNPETPHNTSARQVQTGGFGDPEGLPGQAHGPNEGNVPKVGTFDMAQGSGKGNGTGGAQGRPGVVAEAGFERSQMSITEIDTSDTASRIRNAGFGSGGIDGGTAGTGGNSPSAVKTGAFGDAQPAPAPSARHATPPPEIRPVEILSKPSPQYTAEARRLGVQGEVVLSVVFQADGTLKVVGVIRSLGHGLDQMAEQAASQIKFKPAQQGGKPTNFPAMLHIEFRLA